MTFETRYNYNTGKYQCEDGYLSYWYMLVEGWFTPHAEECLIYVGF